MNPPDGHFFEIMLTAGSILAGFCTSFLVFRIQREADYYRNPSSEGIIDQQHFTSSFLLVILATLLVAIFGVVFPMFYLAGISFALISPRSTVAGLLSAMVLLAGYFFDELYHYHILRKFDKDGWKSEWWILAITICLSIVVAALILRS